MSNARLIQIGQLEELKQKRTALAASIKAKASAIADECALIDVTPTSELDLSDLITHATEAQKKIRELAALSADIEVLQKSLGI